MCLDVLRPGWREGALAPKESNASSSLPLFDPHAVFHRPGRMHGRALVGVGPGSGCTRLGRQRLRPVRGPRGGASRCDGRVGRRCPRRRAEGGCRAGMGPQQLRSMHRACRGLEWRERRRERVVPHPRSQEWCRARMGRKLARAVHGTPRCTVRRDGHRGRLPAQRRVEGRCRAGMGLQRFRPEHRSGRCAVERERHRGWCLHLDRPEEWWRSRLG